MKMEDLKTIKPPFQTDKLKQVRDKACLKSQARLDALIKRYGEPVSGDDGVLRFKNGEDVAGRLIRDGFAVPVDPKKPFYARLMSEAKKDQRGLFKIDKETERMAMIAVKRFLDISDELTR